MKLKIKSYEAKDRKKPKNNKNVYKTQNVKSRGGVADYRKFVNDTTLSETEKRARRMGLEGMRRLTGKPKSKGRNMLLKDNADDAWEEDPFLLKAKQIGELDAGIDESSDEEANEDDTEKYFQTRKTTQDLIDESKMKKYENFKADERFKDLTAEANEKFRVELRTLLPGIGTMAKAMSKNDFKKDQAIYGDMFQKNFESLIYAKRPQRADQKSLQVNIPEKQDEKTINFKLKRLREHLIKDGVVKDEDDGTADEDQDERNEIDEDEDDDDEEENDEDEEENDDSEGDNSDNEAEECESDSNSIEKSIDANIDSEDAYKNIKKLIVQSNKTIKRKLEEDENDQQKEDIKKPMLDNSKNEIDCFRVVLKMKDLRKAALLVMASEISTEGNWSEKSVVRKLIFASLLQDALQNEKAHTYCPELIGFIRSVFQKASNESTCWLSVKSDSTQLSRDRLLNICADNFDDKNLLSISTLFHTCNLLMSVLDLNAGLMDKNSLFLPFVEIINSCPLQLYPSWLTEQLKNLLNRIEQIKKEPVPILTLKKIFYIVELLEPDLNCKFDVDNQLKKTTKNLKDKIKKEKKALKKELKQVNRAKIDKMIAEDIKQSKMRIKKTNEIINGLSQR